MERRLTAFLVCLFLALGTAFAQNRISGTVVSQEDGEPVIGASVKVVGTAQGVTTNVDGKFTISVPSGKKIEISTSA
jgi:cytoskeletal protein CcmA (bactofilin family)